jgi:hypothetical protein
MQHPLILPFLFVLTPLAFAALWCAICLLLSFFSGWRKLALWYATDHSPHGTAFWWQSGYVGLVAYRNCLNIRVAAEGLFLSPVWPFRPGHKTLLIPWRAIHDAEPRQVLWLQFTRFQVGVPTLARIQLPTKVFDARRSPA